MPTLEGIGSASSLPPRGYTVTGFRWDLRQRADGAHVGQTPGGQKLDLLFVVRLAPGHARGHAAGVNIAYRLGGHDYLIPDRIALALSRHC